MNACLPDGESSGHFPYHGLIRLDGSTHRIPCGGDHSGMAGRPAAPGDPFDGKRVAVFKSIRYPFVIMAYWLLKTEPGAYSWDDLVADKKTMWDGVRSFQARNYLKEMKANDVAFLYHSVTERRIVGIAKIVSGPYPDPEAKDWIAVDVAPCRPMVKPVTLDSIKMRKTLAQIPLLRQSRLSVMPITLGQAKALMAMGKTTLAD